VIRRDILGPAAIALALLAASVGLARAADRARATEARAASGGPPLGVLNVIAVDLLWLRADTLFAEGRWPEMLAAYEAVGELAPRLTESWEYRGFHLAYNLAGGCTDEGARDRWVLEGVRVLDEGVRRNPASAGLRAYLGHVLFFRSKRWPSAARLLAERRGRDPVDEAIEHLGAAHEGDPGDGRTVLWMVDALLERGRKRLDTARPGTPAPDAAADFARGAGALAAFAETAPPDGRDLANAMASVLEDLKRAAESRDPAERAAILRGVDQAPPR